MGGCGWCNATGDCMSGNPTGSTSGTCTGTDWVYTVGSCTPPDPCAVHTSDCTSCATALGCGWCTHTAAESDCRTGTSSAPATGSCDTWTYDPSTCV